MQCAQFLRATVMSNTHPSHAKYAKQCHANTDKTSIVRAGMIYIPTILCTLAYRRNRLCGVDSIARICGAKVRPVGQI